MTQSVRHFLQYSTGQGPASVSVDVPLVVSVVVSVPPTDPGEAGAVASAASTIWQLPFANRVVQLCPAPVQWLDLLDLATSVQLLS